MKKKLCRSRNNKKICGVCGGIAEFFNIDATIIRLVAAGLAIFTSYLIGGIVLYLIAAFILPVADEINEV